VGECIARVGWFRGSSVAHGVSSFGTLVIYLSNSPSQPMAKSHPSHAVARIRQSVTLPVAGWFSIREELTHQQQQLSRVLLLLMLTCNIPPYQRVYDLHVNRAVNHRIQSVHPDQVDGLTIPLLNQSRSTCAT